MVHLNPESDYPPASHVLRDLGIDIEHVDVGRADGWLPLRPAITLENGEGRIGALTTLIDCVGGAIAGPIVAPGWMATADLSVEIFAPWTEGWVRAEGHTLRAGRSTVVLQIDLLREVDDQPCGRGYLTFAVLPGREFNPIMGGEQPQGRRSFGDPHGGGALPILSSLGVTDLGGGAISAPVNSYSRNTLDALHGGVVALLIDAASESAMSAHFAANGRDGERARAAALSLTYLARNTTGPVTAVAQLASSSERGLATTTVEVRDEGADRSTAVGWVRYVLDEGGSK